MKYTLLLICCLSIFVGHSQNELDLLPIEGRNELFHTFLMERGGEIWDARRDSVQAALVSPTALLARQEQLRADYISLLGDLPEKTELDAEVVATIQDEGFTIEKLHYQSRPHHHITAHLYIPEGEGPFPTVQIMCGHYPAAKIVALHQRLATLFATNGIAALTIDPFSQGERYQLQNSTTGELEFIGESGTSAHSRLDVGAVLAGTSVVAHALWDNHRGLDYLYSRTDVVDTTKIGITGSSGGGAQATYLMAFDERIKVAAINSFLMNEETLFATIGPQTASQNLAYEGAYSIDHPDYITMFAPKPLLILATSADFFDITATRETHEEAQVVYETLDAAENLAYFEAESQHGYQIERRERAVQWFRYWFYDSDTTSITEPFDIMIRPTTDLLVTATGQVVTNFTDEKTITDLNITMANAYTTDRVAFQMDATTEEFLAKVGEVLRLENYETVEVEEIGTIERTGYSITKLNIKSGDHVPVPALLFVPDNFVAPNPLPAVIYVDGRGKNMDAVEGGVLEQFFVDSGKVVLTIDVRGFGETTDNPSKNETKHGNREHRNSVISNYIGKTLIGQRVEDIRKAIDVAVSREEVDASDITLVGIDRAGSAVLHAAALDNRVSKTIIRQSFESWLPMVGNPTELHNMTHAIPFALKYYDLPDLVNTLPVGAVEYYDDLYEVTTATRQFTERNNYGKLGQNFPNPVSNETVIPYELQRSGVVKIKIYDAVGRLAQIITAGFQTAGTYQLPIRLKNLAGGQYFYQLWLDDQPIGIRNMVGVD